MQDASSSPRAPATVSVVIPTCGNTVDLGRALRSVFATGYEPLEVVVVENRPPDLAAKRLVEEYSSHPVLYAEERRRGASWARNTGLTLSRGEIVAFIDDDVVVEPGWIENAVSAFAEDGGIACVAGRILPLSTEGEIRRRFDEFSAFDKGEQQRLFRLPESRIEEPLFPYTAGHVGSGANILIRREAALAVRGFDPALGTPTVGGEDLDLFIRLVRAGKTILYDPSVIVLHDHPDSLTDLRRHAYRYGKGLTALLSKHFLRGPERLHLLRAIPAGIGYLLDPNSRKNRQKSSNYPKSLDLLEYLGMLLGPFAYAASLAQFARVRRSGRGHPVELQVRPGSARTRR
jgi:O-antigen biosynthesis protein